MNKKEITSKCIAAVLTVAMVFAAAPYTALADITDANDLSPVGAEESTSNVVQVGVVTTEVGTIVAGSGQSIADTTYTSSAIPVDTGTSSGIESAAVGTSSSGTVSSSSSSSGVVTAGSSSNVSGPASGSSSTVTTAGGVVVAGAASVSGIATEGEKNSVYTDILGGATLIMFDSVTDAQILSCMIQTNDGSLIVIDGGYGEDADYLTSQIVQRGGHVAAWLITHPHADHVGALYTILQNQDAAYAAGVEPSVTIDGIYYSMGDANWYQTYDPDEATMAVSLLGELAGRPETMLHSVSQGYTFQVDTATIQVLNNRYQGSSDCGNNASIVYKVTVNGVSILFLGDLPEEGGNYLMQTVNPSALKADIVQMAHHGQNGVSKEFYAQVSPTICLWPTPAWLWVSQESKYTIQETKQWMMELGVQRHYCMKDGDQIIR